MNALSQRHCREFSKDEAPLGGTEAERLAGEIHPDWQLDADRGQIERSFKFKDFYHTIAFVNALAWIANSEDHHPDLEVGYNRCKVRFATHSVGGLTDNDFICAAKVDQLLPEA